MNVLPREKQIEVIATLCEGVGIRTAARLTGVNRGTIGSLAYRVGMGCVELHDRLMVGVRTERLELDEAWSFVGKKQKNVQKHEIAMKGDQYIFIGMAGTQKAIISWGVGKRNTESTMDFLHDLRQRVIGQPEISTDGFHPYRMAIRDAFGDGASHGVIVKTYSVTNLARDAVTRYSPAQVVAVSREVVTGDPEQYVSTSYVERQNLSLRMGSRRFTRLTNGFSKKLDNHVAAVALYVAHYNLCRVHEALRTTPAKAIGIADRTWSIAQLVDAALHVAPALPTETPPDRRRKFTVIQGGKSRVACFQIAGSESARWRRTELNGAAIPGFSRILLDYLGSLLLPSGIATNCALGWCAAWPKSGNALRPGLSVGQSAVQAFIDKFRQFGISENPGRWPASRDVRSHN